MFLTVEASSQRNHTSIEGTLTGLGARALPAPRRIRDREEVNVLFGSSLMPKDILQVGPVLWGVNYPRSAFGLNTTANWARLHVTTHTLLEQKR